MSSEILVTLGDGGEGRPAYLFPGSGGDVWELGLVALRLAGDRPMLGVEPFTPNADGRRPETVDAMARQSIDAIRQRQPQGPYDLIGYSFGGLVVLEIARQLQEAGAVVGLVGLIDPIFDRRYWPLRLFLVAQAKRAATHIAALSRRRFSDAAPEFVARTVRLLSHLVRRAGTSDDGPAKPEAAAAAPMSISDMGSLVMSNTRPRAYSGSVHLFHSAFEPEFGCDPVRLWRPLLVGGFKVRPVPGDHRSVLRDPDSVALLAGHLRDALAQANRAA